jgi:hypothetical protein
MDGVQVSTPNWSSVHRHVKTRPSALLRWLAGHLKVALQLFKLFGSDRCAECTLSAFGPIRAPA